MNIGIDFDNTIVKYDKIFIETAIKNKFISPNWSGNKEKLKENFKDKKKDWMKLQGLVYGPLMRRAVCFPGIKNFLLKARFCNHRIFIISHKTVYGHYDKTKTNLRKQAFAWLEENNFFNKNLYNLSKENVFFCTTRGEKIKKINELDLDFMIDDLNDIFKSNISPKIKTILFNSSLYKNNADYNLESWDQICKLIFSNKENKFGLIKICNTINSDKVITFIDKIKRDGNSNVYKLHDDNRQSFILKEYPNSQIELKPRLKNELSALNLLKNFKNVPKLVSFNEELNLIILNYIEGKKIERVTSKNISEAIIFINKLYEISKKNKKYHFATEACLKANDLTNQIDRRIYNLKSVKNKNLTKTLNKLIELNIKLKNRANDMWPKDNIDKNLGRKFLTFSPSDFGFHNAIMLKNNTTTFIDFEYFGLDDPVKLISDFLWHPAMSLSFSQKILFTRKFLKIFKNDPLLKRRLNAAFSLYGVRWCLIILNKVIKIHFEAKNLYKNSKLTNFEQNIKLQFMKSNQIYDEIVKNKMEFVYDK